jgi:hypothetical protein
MTNAVVGIVPIAVIQHGRATLRLAERSTANAFRRLLKKQ